MRRLKNHSSAKTQLAPEESSSGASSSNQAQCTDQFSPVGICSEKVSKKWYGDAPRDPNSDPGTYCHFLRDTWSSCICGHDCDGAPGMASREMLNNRYGCNLERCSSSQGEQFDDSAACTAIKFSVGQLPFSQMVGGIIGCLVLLWLNDLMILRSFLEVCQVTFGATDTFGPSALAVWSEEWACYLNSRAEAQQALGMLRKFNQSYQAHNRRRIMAPMASPATGLRTKLKSLGQAALFAAKAKKRRFSAHQTEEGSTYYTPEAGGESVWELPPNGKVVNNY